MKNAKKTNQKTPAKAKPMRSSLGKGLSALMAESYSQVAAEVSAPAEDRPGLPQALPLHVIQPGKYQPRGYFDEGALSELADSIRKNGVMQPILVRTISAGKYEIIAGERRWRAAQKAGLDSIPVLVRDDIDDRQVLEMALVENVQREGLHPLEEASGYDRLMREFGYTQEELSGVVHKSRPHISNLLRLLDLPEDIRMMFASDKLSMGHARALMGTHDPSALAHEIVRKGLSVRQTETLIRSGKDPHGRDKWPRAPRASMEQQAAVLGVPVPTQPQPHVQHQPQPPVHYQPHKKEKDPDIMALEETLSENLGLKVSIEDRGQSGEITVAYESLEQLDEVLRRLGGSI